MKWVIVSDNHGMDNILTDIHTMHHDADIFIHLGDSEFEYHNRELKPYFKICGNCDYDAEFKKEIVLQKKDINAYLTHGHLYKVGTSRKQLAQKAAENSCNIALYGHTHIQRTEYIDGVICINPGSIAQSRSEQEETYAVLTFDETEKMITIFNQQHEIIDKEILIF